MVGAIVPQAVTARDYDDRGVRAMHAVLVELGQILGLYRPALVAGLRVQGADAGEVALRNNVSLPVEGQMPDGRPNRVELLLASLPAFLVMKGFALDGRGPADLSCRLRASWFIQHSCQ